MDWERMAMRAAAGLEKGVDRLRASLGRRGRGGRPVRVITYRSYGTERALRVRGRVLHGRPLPPASPADSRRTNLVNTLRRMATDEVPLARVRIRALGQVVDATADEEGHFLAELPLTGPPPAGRLWHEARVEPLDPPGEERIAMVSVPRGARFGIISDLDDTVLETNATRTLRMVAEVLFGNVHTRIPFPGVGAFYRALHASGGTNPLFYVSSSPWNLYDLLSEFLHLHEIPAGPMELRDWGISADEVLPRSHGAHKRRAIDGILDAYPSLPFILVGDSGQEDPEIYREVVRDHPGRVLAIYIRSVLPRRARIEAVTELSSSLTAPGDPQLVLVRDTVEAARHAAGRGWITARALAAVASAHEAGR